LTYTDNPIRLLFSDIILSLSKWTYLGGIITPIRIGATADPYGELYPTYKNIKALILHAFLIVFQSFFLLTIPFFLLCPMSWMAIYAGLFWMINSGVCWILNGTEIRLAPTKDFVPDPKLASEHWVYLNGVSVGYDLPSILRKCEANVHLPGRIGCKATLIGSRTPLDEECTASIIQLLVSFLT
jgi:hypothetical protein